MFEFLLAVLGLGALAGGGYYVALLRARAADPQGKLPFSSAPSAPVLPAPSAPPPSFLSRLADAVTSPPSLVPSPLPPPLPRSTTRTQYDFLILQAANEFIIPPHILKAICRKESSFNPDAINPEGSFFVLNGVRYDANRSGWSEGLRELVRWIKSGSDPASVSLNPSIGLAQVRVTTARDFFPEMQTRDLFDPLTNLRASAAFLRWAFAQGVTLETIDAYNVGVEGRLRRGRSNTSYRDFVKSWAATYQGDF